MNTPYKCIFMTIRKLWSWGTINDGPFAGNANDPYDMRFNHDDEYRYFFLDGRMRRKNSISMDGRKFDQRSKCSS